jgi:polyketide biosynthesis acyl carrier protein
MADEKTQKTIIFETIKKNIVEILPDLADREIKIENNLTELGANSLDRSEIAILSMQDLNLKIPLIELGSVHNINDLVNLFYAKSKG